MPWAIFEPAASRYEAWYATPPGRRADQAERALLAWLLHSFPAAGSVLDVGCGTGHFTAWLASQGLQTLGLERARLPVGDVLGLAAVIADSLTGRNHDEWTTFEERITPLQAACESMGDPRLGGDRLTRRGSRPCTGAQSARGLAL